MGGDDDPYSYMQKELLICLVLQVLVRQCSTSVNPVDYKIAAGAFKPKFIKVLGSSSALDWGRRSANTRELQGVEVCQRAKPCLTLGLKGLGLKGLRRSAQICC